MAASKIPTKLVFTNPIHFLAVGFGSGLAPKAPGTFGTLAAVPLYLALAQLEPTVYALVCAVVCLLGVGICGYTAKALNTHDHPGIVWDEFAGFLITMLAVPLTPINLILGFILFRLFDILKPWPISWLDKRVSGGLGIMIDDIVAGVFALFSLHLILYFF